MGKIAESPGRRWRKLEPPAVVRVSGGGRGVGEVRRRRRRKKVQLPAQPPRRSPPARGPPGSETRRSLRPQRRRHYYCEYYEEFDDDEFEELPRARNADGDGDDEGEDDDDDDEPEARRKEKKLNLVLKKAASPALPPPPPPASDSSEEEEKERHPLKKRRICGNAGDGGGGGVVRQNRSEDEKERTNGRIHRQPGTVSISGSPLSDPRLRVPLPDRKMLEQIMDKLQKKDIYGVFAEPVDEEELPDYHDVIEKPMDFSTVRKRLSSGNYSTLDQLESDIYLISSNAMQYNAPDTVYFKQARAIQELARKKFDKLRVVEIKSAQKTRSTCVAEKPIKNYLVSVQDHPVSDFSSGATVPAAKDACASSNVSLDGGVEKLLNGTADVPSTDGNYIVVEKQRDKIEDTIVKETPHKYGKKSSVLEENRRATYQCGETLVHTDSIYSTFETETKKLIAVGFHGEHSYARSLARFAAILGPTAWAVASKKIEQALPVGYKFGRGWVGEYEPLPTPVLTFEKVQSQPKCNSVSREKTGPKKCKQVNSRRVSENGGDKNLHVNLGSSNDNTETAHRKASIGKDEGSVKLPALEGRPVLIGSADKHQQKTVGMIESKRSEASVLRQNGSSCASSMNGNQVALQMFGHNSGKESSGLLDGSSKNRNAGTAGHSKPPEGGSKGVNFPYQAGSCSQGLPDGNSQSSSEGKSGQLQFNGCPSFVVPSYGHHNVDDPAELVRRLSGRTSGQPQINHDNSVIGFENRILPSVPYMKQENSSASVAAARAWMSIGPTSTSGSTQDNYTSVSMRPENRSFAVPLAPQAIYANGKVAQNGGGRSMGFSQNMIDGNSPKFLMNPQWQGFPNTQKSQKNEMLPPDLNIGFQSPTSPASQSSRMRIDSQQPDLALQL